MELRHLRYFVAVAEAGSVVNAARELNVAQPALSRQIQALERAIGVTLFERLPHGVRLTRAGKIFLVDARKALAAARRAMSRARVGSEVKADHVRVAYAELLAYWAPIADLFSEYRAAHPMVELRAIHMTGPHLPPALREDRIELAIAGVPRWPVRGLDGVRLFDATQTGVLLPANHPVAQSEKIRLADLTPLTWYHLPADATLGCFEAARSALKARGLRTPHKVARPGGFGGLPQIAAGNAFAFADHVLAGAITGRSTGIVYREFVEAPVPIWLALLWKKGQRSRPVLDFIEMAKRISRAAKRG